MLVAQSLILGALFWLMTSAQQQKQIDEDLRANCTSLAAFAPQKRGEEIREILAADVHREQFLAEFAKDGSLIAGNVAKIPDDLVPNGRIVVRSIEPTSLPGVHADVARLILCPMPEGTLLLSGVDRDQAEKASLLIERALFISLVPAILIAIGGGFLAAGQARRRLDAVRLFSERIIAGDLSKRLPVSQRTDGFGMLCAQINSMLDRIEALMGEVKGVGDDIAHQLRTPLTRLRAGLEREMAGARTPIEFEKASVRALNEIDQCLGIVAALLRIREIDDRSRRQNFEDVDLARLVSDVVELYEPFAEADGNRLVVENGRTAVVNGDRDLLMEAISNLVDNAVKYAPDATDIVIRLVVAPQPRIDVVNACEDSFDVESETFFRRFYRGRNVRSVAGSGLGLSLVSAICELHDVEVSIESREATFKVSMVFSN